MNTNTKMIIAILLLLSFRVSADEGMWLISNINKHTNAEMRKLGLKIPQRKIYNKRGTSLKDAVVSFGGFCSGVVVSPQGLIFTNHHCGLEAIQQLSATSHNYLKNGFSANSFAEELPCKGLFVRFLVKQKNVTKKILSRISSETSKSERDSVILARKIKIQKRYSDSSKGIYAEVDSYYAGTEFWLSIYKQYNDVRLVLAPPSYIGNFMKETDNWEWPRHAADFSMFRIYANHNEPADYSEQNTPYQAKIFAPISLNGYQEGDFCMTLGYPGMTNRYLSSFGIVDAMECINQPVIDLRKFRQSILKREMDKDENLSIKYAHKYETSANYYKSCLGVNQSIASLNVLSKKKKIEERLFRWIAQHHPENQTYLNLLQDLKNDYSQVHEIKKSLAYVLEAFLNNTEFTSLVLQILDLDFTQPSEAIQKQFDTLLDSYKNYSFEVDKMVFKKVLVELNKYVDEPFLPEFYKKIGSRPNETYESFADSLFSNTNFASVSGLQTMLTSQDFNLMEDPGVEFTIDLITYFQKMETLLQSNKQSIEKGEKLYSILLREMYDNLDFYPDANSTLRMSYGSVSSYSPKDGVKYKYYTTSKGVLEKINKTTTMDSSPWAGQLKSLLSGNVSEKYLDRSGKLKVCFISNNDITGGNSGSAVFNGKGELLGLAFDGNFEVMSSDYMYSKLYQRSINVDIRYILFLISKLNTKGNLLSELGMSK